jgi:hypothetical protein
MSPLPKKLHISCWHNVKHFNLAKILLSVTLGMGEQGQCDAENNTLEQTFFSLARTVQRK